MSRHRSGSKKAPPEIGLHMECTEEELEPCQIVHYTKAETEYNEIQNKLDTYLNKMKAEVIEKGENCVVLQLNASSTSAHSTSTQVSPVTSGGKVTRQSVQTTQNYQQGVGQGIITRSSANTGGNTYLVMDPRLGLVVGQVPPTTVSTDNATSSPSKPAASSRTRSTPGSVMVTTRARSGVKKPGTATSEPEVLASSTTRTREKAKTQTTGQTTPSSPPTGLLQQVFSGNPSNSPGSYRVKINVKPVPPLIKPSESGSIGGLTAGSKNPWKPNPDEVNKGNAADSKEVAFNKMSGKTFPSLVVAARPHLRLKYIPQANITQERTALDAKVKGVLMYTPSTFIEWLLQEGLIRSEQYCILHVNNDLSSVRLKLGMYTDVTKFPYSGGYVWISACCPSQFISVFNGSIFEAAPHSPTTLLKLIYHWACQTNVQNVVQWVKVDNLYVKNFFTNMRAVCTQAIHQKYQKLGGPRSKIEVGVISLGTTSQDGNMRQVKVEVLGVMDPENKLIRLRALEPVSEEKNFKRRFVKILEPLEDWVHKESTIFTDFTVDKGTLINMGFRTVYQISASDPPTKYSNQNVMEYLRRIVPRMFQNTLSLLSRQIIQQFLDELVWREMWGPIPSQAFDNIIAHIAEQTKLESSETLIQRLSKVAANPFKNWTYSVWKPTVITLTNTKAQVQVQPQQQPQTTDLDSVSLYNRMATKESTESGSSILKNNRTRRRTAEQPAVDVMTSTPIKKAGKFPPKDKVRKEEKPKFLEKSFKKDSSENEKAITDEIVAFINDKKSQICLDSYYYGTKEGEEDIIATENKGACRVRCSICNKRFDDNISLMKHMILHCQLEPCIKVGLSNVQQCAYCFFGFNTSIELKEHLDEVHAAVYNKTPNATDCQICEERFSNRVELVYHMHSTHVEMELPYECGVCHYRSSVYNMLIDHFLTVHRGGEHLLCPFCLKIFTFAYQGKDLPDNVRLFEMHLEKHSRTALTKACHRCKLTFIHKGIVDQHLEADHLSFKCEVGVKPFPDGPNSILMPEPGSLIKPVLPPKSLKIYRARPLFASNKFKQLEINGIEDDMGCMECEGSLMKPDHFTGNFNCLKCRYATCCEKAMAEHVTIFHETPSPQFSLGKPVVLQDSMFCVCGFSTYSGNRLAKHIVACERKSAYSTEEAANVAMDFREEYQSQTQQSDAQNMLNMLGLVRKSPEDGIMSGEAVKKENEVECLEDAVKDECSQSCADNEGDNVSVCNMETEVCEKSDDSTEKDDSNAKEHRDTAEEEVQDSSLEPEDQAANEGEMKEEPENMKTEDMYEENICEKMECEDIDKLDNSDGNTTEKIREENISTEKEESSTVKDLIAVDVSEEDALDKGKVKGEDKIETAMEIDEISETQPDSGRNVEECEDIEMSDLSGKKDEFVADGTTKNVEVTTTDNTREQSETAVEEYSCDVAEDTKSDTIGDDEITKERLIDVEVPTSAGIDDGITETKEGPEAVDIVMEE